MKFKGVIFDLDGTLVNSLEDLADSMNNILKSHNFPTHALSDYKHFIVNGIRNLVYKTLPEANRSDALITECYNQMMRIIVTIVLVKQNHMMELPDYLTN